MILIYGAYGYTGQLIVDEALKNKLPITVAGRSLKKTETLAKEKKVPFIAFDLDDIKKVTELIKPFNLVIHCAGPFEFTAEIMARACILSSTHYIDITGEYQVFEMLHGMDSEAKNSEIMLLPGAGFDVVPSDCLAANLKDRLPEGNDLKLAFTSTKGSLSRGTAKTMVENIDKGQLYRSKGKLKKRAQGKRVEKINYGPFEQISAAISWGDICTAFYSTGIPNIEVLTGSSKDQVNKMKWMNRLKFILSCRWVKDLFIKQIDKKPAGPSEERRKKADMYLYGKITKGDKSVEMRIKTPNGYTLTAAAAVLIAKKITSGDYKAGYQTPSTAYGKDLIFEIEGCEELK